MQSISFTPEEQQFIEKAKDLAITEKRVKVTMVTGTFAVLALAMVTIVTESAYLVGSVALLYMVITLAEKRAYGNGVMVYKSVINKFRTHLEESGALDQVE